MIHSHDRTSPDFLNEHGKYLQAISVFVTCLAFIHMGILAYAGAYGTLMLNAAASGTITLLTFNLFRTGRIKTAEVLLSLGGAIFIGIYCYKSSEVGNPNALLILAALQAPLFMPHLNIAWNVVGIVVPVIMFIFLQQPGFHAPEQLPLTPETEAIINAGIIASCTAFISLARVFGMRRFIAIRKQHQEREAQLIHASKMASLGEMAPGIAHKINNPLTILDGFSWKALRALEEELERKIFEPFFTTKDVGLGTGIGLSISKNIMENLGGCLTLTQESGKNCFIIAMPRDLSRLALVV